MKRRYAEAELTLGRDAILAGIGVPIIVDLIVHVSGREAVEQIRWARAHGLNVLAETCPQYLFLTADDLGLDDGYPAHVSARSPPPRDRGNQAVIRQGIALCALIHGKDGRVLCLRKY